MSMPTAIFVSRFKFSLVEGDMAGRLLVTSGSVKLYQGAVNTSFTPQTEMIPGREDDQIANNAGGVSFKLDEWKVLDRFLVLGSEGGTYYVSENKLTKDNVKNVRACIKENGPRVVARVIEISDAGRAFKNDPALFVLALCAKEGDESTRKAAYFALPKVARIGTHLFHFLAFVNELGGWGRGLKRAVANWYLDKDPEKLGYQVTKYQQRDGWSHADALRLSHPKTADKVYNAIFKWILGSDIKVREAKLLPPAIVGLEKVKLADDMDELVALISTYKLDREMIPTEFQTKPEVQMALLERGMPMTALIRNLGNLAKSGVLSPSNLGLANSIADQLTDVEALKKARIHPISVLMASVVYAQGHGVFGKGEWKPMATIKDALDEAFYKSFASVEPTGKRMLLGLDVSSSMHGSKIAGTFLSAEVGTAAMAMVTFKTEKNAQLMAFADRFVELDLSRRNRLDEVIKYMYGMGFGGTNCALPMAYATEHKIPVDLFVVYTDSETWGAGGRGYGFGYNYQTGHPAQELQKYRKVMGIPAKLVVVGMTATECSIADPKDPGMLDVAGFDASVPEVLRGFALGTF
jgi:60 kDa SS-A/Ro ribonucleoprotein